MSDQLAPATAAVLAKLVESLVANGKLDRAREVVEAMRIACDEATALINACRKRP